MGYLIMRMGPSGLGVVGRLGSNPEPTNQKIDLDEFWTVQCRSEGMPTWLTSRTLKSEQGKTDQQKCSQLPHRSLLPILHDCLSVSTIA
jgi:hypothetical protein